MQNHGTKALQIVRATLPELRNPQSVQRALSDRLTLSEAIGIVAKMLRGYANGGQQAGDSYIGALAEVLASYPRCVAHNAGDLVKGVPRECKFLPTPADIIAWCEREGDYLNRIQARHERAQKLVDEARERRAQADDYQTARSTRPTYDDLKAKYGPNWGIKQPAEESKAARLALLTQANAAAFDRECRATKSDPDQGVSPTLGEILKGHPMFARKAA